MITPIHLAFDIGVYSLLSKANIVSVNNIDLILFFAAELMDLDHLFSKPIYVLGRNPFKTHILHKNWLIVLIVAVLLILYRPTLFLGIGLLSHLFLDYCYATMFKLKKKLK